MERDSNAFRFMTVGWSRTTDPDYVDSEGLEIRQEAIPWCTTHDSKVASPPPLLTCEWVLAHWDDVATIQPCNPSTGGPDHKWWRDES